MHVLGTRVPRRLGVARSASSPKAALALGCSLTPGLRISFGRVTCMARAASVPGLWALGFLLLACVGGWVRVAVGLWFCFHLPVVAGVLGGCVWARFVVLSLFCRLFVVFVVGLWCWPAFGTCVVSCAFPLPPAAVWACVLGPGLGCAPPFLAGLSGCVFFFFFPFFFFFRLLVVCPPVSFLFGWAAGFFFFLVSACFGAPSPAGPPFLAWCCRFLLGGPPVPVWGSCLRCPPGGGFGLLLCFWRAVWWLWALFARPPFPRPPFFFLGGGGGGGGLAVSPFAFPRLALALWLVCRVVGPSPLLAEVPVCYSPPLLAGFRCRWWWAVPATPGWGPLAAVVCGVWCVAVVCWWGCGWCVVWLVPRHSWRRFLCATPRHSWLGFAGGGGVWCVVCGVWRWCVVGVVVGVWCGWSLATPGGGPCVLLPATPGWVSLAAVVCGVWCVVCGGGVLVGLWLVCGVVGPSPLLAEVPVCYSPPLLAGFRCRWRWAFPATPGWGPLAAVVCGVWCVVCGGGVLLGLWLVCGVVGPSPLLAEVPVCYSPPLLAGFRCRCWWAVPATPGWGPLAAVVCGVWCVVVVCCWACGWCVAVVCCWGCGWCVVWLVPRHSWRRSLCATPRHYWLGFAAAGGGRSPPLLAGVRWRRWCVVCGVWWWCVVGLVVGVWRWCVVGVVVGVWCGWSLATPGGGSCVLLPATPGWVPLPLVVGGPRHSWLGSAGGGGVWCVFVCVLCLAGSGGPASWARSGAPHLFLWPLCLPALPGPLRAGVAPLSFAAVAVPRWLFFSASRCLALRALPPRLCLPLGRWLLFGGCSPAPLPFCVSRFSLLLLGALVFFFFFPPSSSSSLRPRCLWFALVSGPGCPGPRRLRCLLCLPSVSRLFARLSLFRAFRLVVGCSRVVAAPPPPFVFRGFRSCRSLLCAVWCCASLGAVLRRAAARCVARCSAVVCCVALVWCRCLLRRALWRCPSPWGPVLCGTVFCGVPPRCVLCAVCVLSWRRGACCCSPLCLVLCVSRGAVLCVPCALRSVRCCASLCWCARVVLFVWCVLLLLAPGAVVRCCVLCCFLWCAVVRCWVWWPVAVCWWRVSVSVSLSGRVVCFPVVGVVCCGALLSCVVFCGAVLSRGAVLLCSAVVLRCCWGLLCPPVGCRAVLCCAVGWLCCLWPGGGVCALWCSFPCAVRSLSSPLCALRCPVVLAVVPCFPVSCAVALCCRVVLCCRALLSFCGAVCVGFALLRPVVRRQCGLRCCWCLVLWRVLVRCGVSLGVLRCGGAALVCRGVLLCCALSCGVLRPVPCPAVLCCPAVLWCLFFLLSCFPLLKTPAVFPCL